ncbi:thioesterase-like superfamily-domain-containing protein [Dactylonectria estremocensis]|uniref:Thioesterase-like superfamily-domain-containing protein n=1 Tax=Dactylonectria estremocensis TaxID=1079267 RepID=A0A9P9EUR2_9HYPO|nr:thioesterase-like superfamily-domain-containing protein [Dactylonectria estremocensis]
MSFQEAMELQKLPDVLSAGQKHEKRFMNRQPPWMPGTELPWESIGVSAVKVIRGAYGGVVYAMATLAAARVVEEEDIKSGYDEKEGRRAIHTIQAVFTNPGLLDRPFIFNVSEIHSSRSFSTRVVNAHQSTEPSVNPSGPFPASDANSPPGDKCFSCLVTFKRPTPGPSDFQGSSPHHRYRKILSSRPPEEWDHCPQADIDAIKDTFPNAGPGAFPILDMRKVDMSEYNADKELPDRRELVLYRLLAPIPREDVNAHITCHAFEADRNGIIMLGNHLGYGYSLGVAATLSYSFYVHVNPEEAVMHGDGWWVQEVYWPRYSAGRGLMMSFTWSPEGKHVATGYQDGILFPSTSRDAKDIPRL